MTMTATAPAATTYDARFTHLPIAWQDYISRFLDRIEGISGSAHSRREYAGCLAHFLSDMRDPATIDEADIRTFLAQPSRSRRNLGEPVGVFGARQRLIVVKAFLVFVSHFIGEDGQPLYRRAIDWEALYIAYPRLERSYAKTSSQAAPRPLTMLAPASTPLDESERLLWQQVRESFLESKRGKSGSRDTFRRYKSVLTAFFGDVFTKSPADVSMQECVVFINAPCIGRVHQGEPASAGTRYSRLAILSSFYAYAQHYTLPGPDGHPRRLLPVDFVPPTHSITPPKRTHSYHPLSMTELERIFAQIPDDIRGKRDRSFLTFALLSGRRRAEVARLRWKDIKSVVFESGRAGLTYSYTGKGGGGQERTKELPTTCWQLLLDYLRASGRYDTMQPDSPLWTCIPSWRQPGGFYTAETSIKGQEQPRQAGRYTVDTPLGADGMGEILQHYAQAAGIDPARATMHALRHLIALERYRLTRDPRAIMRFLDHSSLSTTQVYLEELTTAEDDDVARMEARFTFLASLASEQREVRA